MQTELHAAYSILERGARSKVRAPLFLRLFRIKTISLTIRMLYAGTLIRASRRYLATGIKDEQLKEMTLEESLEVQAKHGNAIARCVATAVINSRYLDWILGRWLGGYLLDNLPWREIRALLEYTLVYGGISDFMPTTRLVRAVKITDPQNQGQKKKGS